MSGFRDEVAAWAALVEARSQRIYVRVATACKDSIVEGSSVSGAPGQPVDTGYLKGSWQLTFDDEGALISTNVAYAPVIEENTRAAYDARGTQRPANLVSQQGGSRPHQRSQVGGPHSVALTRAAFQSFVERAVVEDRAA